MNLVTELRMLADEHHEMLGDIHIPLNRAADCIEDLVKALEVLLGDFDEHPDDFMPDWHKARGALSKAKGAI